MRKYIKKNVENKAFFQVYAVGIFTVATNYAGKLSLMVNFGTKSSGFFLENTGFSPVLMLDYNQLSI